jgi:hypothetical protein
MNPIRWWLSWGVHLVLWWTRERPKLCRPKTMEEPRCDRGHLLRRRQDGKMVSDHSCSEYL